ncbi:MAG: hypothetical protein ACTHMU_24160, partial [Thermomicrobiales bacterium]
MAAANSAQTVLVANKADVVMGMSLAEAGEILYAIQDYVILRLLNLLPNSCQFIEKRIHLELVEHRA